jgi:hypothetical protein
MYDPKLDPLTYFCPCEFERGLDELVIHHKHRRVIVRTPIFDGPLAIDELPKLKRRVRNALRARAWFSRQGPAWAQPLPLNEDERENILCSSYFQRHLVMFYSYSLDANDYDYLHHPLLYDFARGVMASPHIGEISLLNDPKLLAEFPPKVLPGLGDDGIWHPPSKSVSTLSEIRTPL